MTLGLAIADVLASGLGAVDGSIETKGALVSALGRAPLAAVTGLIGPTLFRSLYWFVGAFVLVAVGRRMLRMDLLVAPGSAG